MKRKYLKRLVVATLVSFIASGSVPFSTMANTLETPIFANESSPTNETMNIQSSEIDIYYILDALSNADLGKEFSFFPLEEVDENLQSFDSRSNLFEFDTVEEAIEFFRVLSRAMEHSDNATYVDPYDPYIERLMYYINRSSGNDIASGMAQGGAWSLWTVYNRHISYTYSRSASGLKTINNITNSWPTAMIQIAATWTHQFGGSISQPGHHTQGRVTAHGTWTFGIAVGGTQIGSSTNAIWTLSTNT